VNLRWSKYRMVATVEAYLDTPQVTLGGVLQFDTRGAKRLVS